MAAPSVFTGCCDSVKPSSSVPVWGAGHPAPSIKPDECPRTARNTGTCRRRHGLHLHESPAAPDPTLQVAHQHPTRQMPDESGNEAVDERDEDEQVLEP